MFEEDEKPCPKCGGPMVLRTARNGQYAGKQFYGCAAFPKCRGIRDLTQAVPPTSVPDASLPQPLGGDPAQSWKVSPALVEEKPNVLHEMIKERMKNGW